MEVGPHPHIGLSTVTWLLEGEALHTDSLGTEQVIRPGQLNLMTAGHGIAHAELAARPPFRGVQMWVAQPEATRHGASAFEHHAELPGSSSTGTRAGVPRLAAGRHLPGPHRHRAARRRPHAAQGTTVAAAVTAPPSTRWCRSTARCGSVPRSSSRAGWRSSRPGSTSWRSRPARRVARAAPRRRAARRGGRDVVELRRPRPRRAHGRVARVAGPHRPVRCRALRARAHRGPATAVGPRGPRLTRRRLRAHLSLASAPATKSAHIEPGGAPGDPVVDGAADGHPSNGRGCSWPIQAVVCRRPSPRTTRRRSRWWSRSCRARRRRAGRGPGRSRPGRRAPQQLPHRSATSARGGALAARLVLVEHLARRGRAPARSRRVRSGPRRWPRSRTRRPSRAGTARRPSASEHIPSPNSLEVGGVDQPVFEGGPSTTSGMPTSRASLTKKTLEEIRIASWRSSQPWSASSKLRGA
jgi:hypothetical protein